MLPILLPGLLLIISLKIKLFSFLDIPIDFGATLHGKRIFGQNKRLKAILLMVSFSILVSCLLYLGYWNGFSLYINQIFSENPIRIGILYSFSYTLGELINSFVKRRMNILPGNTVSSQFKNTQTFFDLSDGIILTILSLIIFTSVSVTEAVLAGAIGILLHYCTDMWMKKLRLKH